MSAVNLLKGLVRTVVTKARQTGHRDVGRADAIFSEIDKLSDLSNELGGPEALASGKAQRTHDRIVDLLGIDMQALLAAEGAEDLSSIAASMAANVARRTLNTGPAGMFGDDEELFPSAKQSPDGHKMAKCSCERRVMDSTVDRLCLSGIFLTHIYHTHTHTHTHKLTNHNVRTRLFVQFQTSFPAISVLLPCGER